MYLLIYLCIYVCFGHAAACGILVPQPDQTQAHGNESKMSEPLDHLGIPRKGREFFFFFLAVPHGMQDPSFPSPPGFN